MRTLFLLAMISSLVLITSCKSAPDKASSEATPVETESTTNAEPTPVAETKPETKAEPEAKAETCAALPEWRFERIPLPPEFAPELPAGVEKLYFAPGMFKPESASYWSYVFSIAANDHEFGDAAAMKTLLEGYYDGLIGAVGKSKKLGPFAKATVAIEKTGDGFSATIGTFDAFTKGDPITVVLDIRVSADRKCLNVAASPAEKSAAVWGDLAKARECVTCP